MALTVTCPSCNRSLKAPESLAGRRVKCPGCSVPFDIPVPTEEGTTDPLSWLPALEPSVAPPPQPAPAPLPVPVAPSVVATPSTEFAGIQDDTGEPRPYTLAALRSGWLHFNIGLSIVAINTVAASGIAILFLLAILVNRSAAFEFMVVFPYVVLIAVVVHAVGLWFCSEMPAVCTERPLMMAAFLLHGAGAAGLWLARIIAWAQAFNSPVLAAMTFYGVIASGFAILAAFAFFAFALRGTAAYFKNAILTMGFFGYLVFLACIFPAYLLIQACTIPFAVAGRVHSISDFEVRGIFDLLLMGSILLVNAMWLSYLLFTLRNLVLRAPQTTSEPG